ncbi:hypothetical protein L6452_40422 [Arctium lappa]|uniref:Uncharacterized protein n=1 Tax=Arctium lappa TaxID=4217 RepID=A0ACB8XM33_ARCLA|nr:hypothetical protein L6452_40422 [Arctium lappa]
MFRPPMNESDEDFEWLNGLYKEFTFANYFHTGLDHTREKDIVRESGVVKIRIQGACSGHPSSSVTLKSGEFNMPHFSYVKVVEQELDLEDENGELTCQLTEGCSIDQSNDASSSKDKATTLHPAYTVTNIQTKIRTLDGSKVTYSSWTKLFRLHAKAYKVLDHIDDTPAPPQTDSGYHQWVEIDALVLQWIYSTLSDELMVRILESDTTAQAAWNKLKTNFLNNKGSRAATLEQEFSNLTLGACSSMEAYCQKLKDLADQLGDVDNPVTEARLVLQMVRGLPPEFDVVGAYINQSSPSWETDRSMLQLEQQRQTARKNQTHTVLAAPTSVDRPSHNPTGAQRGQTPTHHNYSGRGTSGRSRGSNSRGRDRSFRGRGGRGQQYWNQGNQNQWHQQNWNPSPSWTPLPSAYPSHGPSM